MKLESLKSPRFTGGIGESMMAKIFGGGTDGPTSGGISTVYGKEVKFDSDYRFANADGKLCMEYRLEGKEVACWTAP